MTKQAQILVVLMILMLILAACGGGTQEATPTSVPPTAAEPTRTAAPTIEPTPTQELASMTLEELQARADAITAEIAIEQRHMEGASGFEGAQVQDLLDRLNRELREVLALIEAAGGAQATEEATTEAGS